MNTDTIAWVAIVFGLLVICFNVLILIGMYRQHTGAPTLEQRYRSWRYRRAIRRELQRNRREYLRKRGMR